MHYLDLENLGPISSYSLTDLKKSIRSLESYQFVSDNSIIINFYDKYTTLVVQFDLRGNFKKVIYQNINIPTSNKVTYRIKKILQHYLPFCH